MGIQLTIDRGEPHTVDGRNRTPGGRDDDASGSQRVFNRRTFLKAGGGAAFVGLGTSRRVRAQRDYWTLVALPDTQNYAADARLVPYAQDQTNWIVDNLRSENIAFVVHEGDLVDDGASLSQWNRIDGVMETLDGDLDSNPDGLVPYATPPGDHDWAVEEDRGSSSENYRRFFGRTRYAGRSWFGGAAPNDLSHFQFFSAGGVDFLHIGLEWEAPGDASEEETPLGWAQSLLDRYPERPTIITTHAYLWDGVPPGRTFFVEEENDNGSSGERIWREIVEPNPQVFMVLNGHFHTRVCRLGFGRLSQESGARICANDGEYHQVSVNAAGLPVFETLADYQDYPNGGNGWMRLVQFVPGGGRAGQDRIQVRTYSPSLDQFATDDSSQFGFDLGFADRFSPS